ncbi:Uncharacterized protein TCM_012504 [Theobroma cacao]|uniref:Transmembrane protein n=1 Tax=Theobroma cacao TaxID=3641 RepID=A0A061FWA2_THECC|nr:Uncharacterized protein TCM_012504 [Theobroma cacao]
MGRISSFVPRFIVFMLIILVLAMQSAPVSADLKLRKLGNKPLPSPPPTPAWARTKSHIPMIQPPPPF